MLEYFFRKSLFINQLAEVTKDFICRMYIPIWSNIDIVQCPDFFSRFSLIFLAKYLVNKFFWTNFGSVKTLAGANWINIVVNQLCTSNGRIASYWMGKVSGWTDIVSERGQDHLEFNDKSLLIWVSEKPSLSIL